VLPETGSREAYPTPCFREVVLFFPCEETFRKSEDKLNRLWWREEKTDRLQFRTLANMVEREGKLIQEHVDKKAEAILQSNGFTPEGLLMEQKQACERIAPEAFLAQETVCQMIEALNTENAPERHIDASEVQETFEDPHQVKATIALDDVCCKKQKAAGRKKGSPPKDKKERITNTLAYIQSGTGETYTLNTATSTHMMILLLAFLVHNGLMRRAGPVVFFTDGARDLRGAIEHLFGVVPFKIILDWYHLEKKCKDLLSMAINGKQVKEQLLSELLAWLWLGKVERAVQVLREVNEETIKNRKELDNLINYCERNRSCIPCYALRKKLGLGLSSNQVEKANDVVVSNRQKHNGMSWSADGSTSLATLTTVRRNAEDSNWLLKHDISFQFHAGTAMSAA
jgi:hypothetical protein